MATAPTYCTQRELKDVFPQVDSFYNKKALYGWTSTDTTNQYQANNTGLITQLYLDGIEGTSVSDSPNANYEYNYSSSTDSVQVFLTTSAGATLDPNDILMEAGEDWATLNERMRANASRYVDAKLDPNLPREQLKDKEGNFDYIIVRTTALVAAVFFIRSHDPTSEVANALMEDAQGNIDALNKGNAALSWQTTGDSSKGIIRDVSYTDGSVRPVDTRGRWHGTFDLVRVKIEDGGAMDGTATYSVWVKDGNKLGNQQGSQVVTSEKITGDYQSLSGGLQIRFGGSTKTSVATATNEWEIEVSGWAEEVDNSTINAVKMTRSGTMRRRRTYRYVPRNLEN